MLPTFQLAHHGRSEQQYYSKSQFSHQLSRHGEDRTAMRRAWLKEIKTIIYPYRPRLICMVHVQVIIRTIHGWYIYIYRSLLLLIQIADPFAVANSRGRSERDWTSRCAWHVKQCHQWIWVFPKVGVPQNGWFVKKTPLKCKIWGYTYFWKHQFFAASRFQHSEIFQE